MKKSIASILVLLALSVTQAHAIPITYSMTGNGGYDNPVGTFTYDVERNSYTNVSLWSLDHYSRASGSAATLNSRGLIGTVLQLTFTRPLSDAGGNISFQGYEQGLLTIFGRVTRTGEVSGGGATSVPEPGALLLLGAGLIGLGLVRRRSAAKSR